MGKDSGISWTDHTFNPWWGCWKVSPGCTNCYAWTFDKRVGGDHWHKHGKRRFFGLKHWQEPLKWDEAAGISGVRHRVFCASMADVFEDHPELIEERQRLWDLICKTPSLDWLLLTKRPENIARHLDLVRGPLGLTGLEQMERGPMPNVWLGTTVEDQEYADRRIPELLKIPAAVRFLSVEPMLGPVRLNLMDWWDFSDGSHAVTPRSRLSRPDWVICGGESGPKFRPFEVEWARDLREQCRLAGVPLFFKQDASLKPGSKGRIPPDLWACKEFPAVPEALHAQA